MGEYELHAGLSILNINNKKTENLKNGLYAIEPFATAGSGKVYEGKPSGIYILADDKNVRNPQAREILNFIIEEYKTLPFCSRWLVKKFGTSSLFALRQLEENGNLHQYPQLVEASHNKVSQTENTILVDSKEVKVTTE
jgi:methionyl aminopeptidase